MTSTLESANDNNVKFGDDFVKAYLPFFNPSHIRLNNGSFGCAPQIVLKAVDELRKEWRTTPDKFWYERLAVLMDKAREVVGNDFLKCDPERLVIIDNVTTATMVVVNYVLDHVLREEAKRKRDITLTTTSSSGGNRIGDNIEYVILVSVHSYNAVKLAFASLAYRLPECFRIEVVKTPFPVQSEADVIKAYQQKLASVFSGVVKANTNSTSPTTTKQKTTKPFKTIVPLLAVLDHISSLPSYIFPVKEIVALCKDTYGFQYAFVDGAHAPGTIPNLSMSERSLGKFDFYTGNLHKWCFADTAAAFLYIRPPIAMGSTHHPLISHNFNTQANVKAHDGHLPGGLIAECRMLGTRDYAPMLAVPVAMKFYLQTMQGVKCTKRNKELAWEIVSYLSKEFAKMEREEEEKDGPTISTIQASLCGAPRKMCASTPMVGLPKSIGTTWADGEKLRVWLRNDGFDDVSGTKQKYESIIIQRPFPAANRLWLRVSSAAYNTLHQYKILARAIQAFIVLQKGS
eukprot:g4080.t1